MLGSAWEASLRTEIERNLTQKTQLFAHRVETDRAHSLPEIAAPGTLENYRVREWLAFIATELHKNAGPLFNPKTPEATRAMQIEALKGRLRYVNDALAKQAFLVGEHFTVADAYLFTILSWHERLHIELSEFPHLKAYYERIKARPAVQTVLKTEGSPN